MSEQLELLVGSEQHKRVILSRPFLKALDDALFCCSSWKDKYHTVNQKRLNLFHTCDYMVFLYFLLQVRSGLGESHCFSIPMNSFSCFFPLHFFCSSPSRSMEESRRRRFG